MNPRFVVPDETDELLVLVGWLQGERALAEQRIVALEREAERLRGALRDVVDRFTRPELPDHPPEPRP